MSKKREGFRRILIKTRSDLEREIRAKIQDIKDYGTNSEVNRAFDVDVVPISEIENLDISLAEMESKMLLAVNEALERLDHGEYGRCKSCGNEISTQRLNALPSAIRCKECQEAKEAQEVVYASSDITSFDF